jgi:arylsulfatase A-like enzyme
MNRTVTAIALYLVSVTSVSASERPNIVLLMCDDLGWGDVGFNGGTTIKTPHLDEMARSSMRFSRFYAQAPVCSPTRGSCLTGRHPYRYGVYFANTGHLKPEERTLAELLQEHGYATGHFGKWHLGTLTKTIKDSNRGGQARHTQHFSPPQNNGFDVCFSTEAKVPTFDPMLKPQGKARNAWDAIEEISQAEPYGTHYWNERGEIVTDNLEGDDSRIIMDRAIPFIRQASDKQQSFFAVIWFHAPHLPVVAGPAHVQLYPRHLDALTRNYFGCVTALDEQVGRLRATLAELGVARNTMVCFCSDNGPEGDANSPGSAGPFRGRKRSLYEGGVRVPGLIEWPQRIPEGKTTNFPAITSDYLPTILDAVDIEWMPRRPLDGISLLPVIDGRLTERPRPIGFQSRGQVALSDNRFKLVGNQQMTAWELYDLTDDPSENHNIAAQHPSIVNSMAATFQQWHQSCAASDQGEDY